MSLNFQKWTYVLNAAIQIKKIIMYVLIAETNWFFVITNFFGKIKSLFPHQKFEFVSIMSLLRENVIFDYYVSLVLIEINSKKSKNVLIVEDWFMSLRFSMCMSLLATKSYVLIASTPFKSSKNAICESFMLTSPLPASDIALCQLLCLYFRWRNFTEIFCIVGWCSQIVVIFSSCKYCQNN